MTNRNKVGVFFKVSGFTPHQIDLIVNKTTRVKKALKEARQRKKETKRLMHFVWEAEKKFKAEERQKKRQKDREAKKPTRRDRKHSQIENGFKVAKSLMNRDMLNESQRIVPYTFFHVGNGPAWTDGKSINFEIKQMIKWAKIEEVSFERCFSESVSHEHIHCILRQEISYKAYETLDNICSKKMSMLTKDPWKVLLKKWRGGIPWSTK